LDWIKPLQEITLADLDTVGAKAAHLGAMLRAGFSVPPGFVITTDAFVDHFGHITDPLIKPPTPRLAGEFMASVVSAMITHLGEEVEVAVRSSSTEEDSAFASFAGQHSTYYFITPTRLDQAIIDCWLSLWSPSTISYRRAGLGKVASGAPLRMAVIVQKMLPATRAGVAFSKDPISASKDCVVEASWGLGAALVDGRVSADHARISEDGPLISYTVRDKRVQVLHHASNQHASRLQPVDTAKRNAPVMTSREVEQIASIALQLETLFEKPQDVEFAFVDNDLFLLQSRPITTRPPEYPFTESLVLFKPLAENFTEPLTPLSADLFARAIPPVASLVDGRLYLNLAMLKHLIPFEMSDAEASEMLLLRGNPAAVQFNGRRTLKVVGMGLLAYLLDGANWHRAARLSINDLERYSHVATRVRHKRTLSLNKAMRRLFWGMHSFLPTYHQVFTLNLSAGRYFIYLGLLEYIVKRFAPDYPIEELPRTYHGRRDMRPLEMLDELSQLAALLEKYPDIQSSLADEPMLPPGHEFTTAFDEFLRKYGHRGPRELDVAAPRWRETPRDLLALLRGGTDAQTNRSHGQYLAARDELHRLLKPWQRKVIDQLTNRISQFIVLRENTRHFHVMAFDVMRSRILDLEKTLFDLGRLEHEGDIFFLLTDEVDQLATGRMDPVLAQENVRARRRMWQATAARPVPETINLDVASSKQPADVIRGLCASPGYGQGRARVIMDPSQSDTLETGEILIAPYTDPAWTPLFQKAAAIVVGTGSFLSHAGTVARELHVPCVVDYPDCTRVFKTGDILRVNASHGSVEIVDDTSPGDTTVPAEA